MPRSSRNARRTRPRRTRRSSGNARNSNRRTQELIGAATTFTSYDPPQILDVPRMYIKRQTPYTFSSTADLQPITQSMSADTFGQYQFDVASLTNISAIAAVFSQMRVLQVDLHFLPMQNVSGNLVTAIEYTNLTPASITEVLQYGTSQSNPAGSSFHRIINPRAMMSGGPSNTNYSPQWGRWFETSSATALNGLIYGLDQGTATVTAWTVRATFICQVRNTI